MACAYVFADESGNFDFRRIQGASRYFILTTATMSDCAPGDELLAVRRDMALNGLAVAKSFHAAHDDWPVRQRVLSLIARHSIRIDATILEKRKAKPEIRPTDERFYKMAWYLHLKYLAPRVTAPGDELKVIAASIGQKKRFHAYCGAIDDVVSQVSPTLSFKAGACPAEADPCLQIADYCSWAISRKWEHGKDDAYRLISANVRSEFDVFGKGTMYFY